MFEPEVLRDRWRMTSSSLTAHALPPAPDIGCSYDDDDCAARKMADAVTSGQTTAFQPMYASSTTGNNLNAGGGGGPVRSNCCRSDSAGNSPSQSPPGLQIDRITDNCGFVLYTVGHLTYGLQTEGGFHQRKLTLLGELHNAVKMKQISN